MKVQSLGWEDPLEEEMTTHSSILAWEIPRTEEPGGLQFKGSQSRTRQQLDTAQHIMMDIYHFLCQDPQNMQRDRVLM